MADEKIKKLFIDGVYKVFSTMFNQAMSSDDGICLFRLKNEDTNKLYREQKYRQYGKPAVLVSKVQETPVDSKNYVERQKMEAEFTVPLKSLTDNGIKMDSKDIQELKKGIILYKGTYYEILKIQGTAFVENVYLLWHFHCIEIEDTDCYNIIEYPPENTGNKPSGGNPDVSVDITVKGEDNDGKA